MTSTDMIVAADVGVPDRATLEALSDSDLLHGLEASLGLSAKAIARAAAFWAELTRRGRDLSGYKFALRDYMEAVATGRLLPEAVMMLSGRLRTLNAVAALPVDEQRRLVDGGKIDVVKSDGSVEPRTLDELTWSETARVIQDGIVRTPAEQKIALDRAQAAMRRRGPRRGRPARILVKLDEGVVQLGSNSIPLDRLLAALRAAGYDMEPKP